MLKASNINIERSKKYTDNVILRCDESKQQRNHKLK